MAYPARNRSVNRELEQGSVDGTYKQVIKDRGGVVEHITPDNLLDLSWKYYGITEARTMPTPDGLTMTPLYPTDTRQPGECH
jgi:hypothetical protein